MLKRIILALLLMGLAYSVNAQTPNPPITLEATLIYTLEDIGSVVDIAWSFDGQYLAVVAYSGQISIFDSTDWSLVGLAECGQYDRLAEHALDWSPSELALAVTCQQQLDFMKVTNLDNDIRLILFRDDPVDSIFSYEAIAWSPNGNQIALAYGAKVNPTREDYIVILDTIQTLVSSADIPNEAILLPSLAEYIDIVWSPSGQYLAMIRSELLYWVEIWDIEGRQKLRDFPSAYQVTWSQDSQRVFLIFNGAFQDRVEEWSLFPIEQINTATFPVKGMFVIGHPQYLLVCNDSVLWLYDKFSIEAQRVQIANSTDGIHCPFNAIDWSSTNRLAIAGRADNPRGDIKIWQLNETASITEGE